MPILTGEEIKRQIAACNISITPYNPKRVQPASVDLTLGKSIAVYDAVYRPTDTSEARTFVPERCLVLDVRQQNTTTAITMPDEGYVIRPGILYLMHTVETVHTDDYVSVLDGKSSIARLGIVVHLTAGYGDPGFHGQYTLEVTCVHPVRIYPKMAIAQIRFHTVLGELSSYQEKGHYKSFNAFGAVPSLSYKQFEEDA